MNKILNNNKGIVLIVCYFTLVALLGLSAVVFLRTINENRLAQRSSNSLEAFYAAEAGASYAYAEASSAGFGWYTHVDKDRPITGKNLKAFKEELVQEVLALGKAKNRGQAKKLVEEEFTAIGFPPHPNEGHDYTPDTSMPQAGIIDITTSDGTAGCYSVAGKNFLVKSYPEVVEAEFKDVAIILANAEVNGVRRTIELRLGQEPAYYNFFFYSGDKQFGDVTINGRNYGAIHVNGNIILYGDQSFNYLTKLSAGSNTSGKGYIERKFYGRFADWDGNKSYSSNPGDPTNLDGNMYDNINTHFDTGETTFITGTAEDYTKATLPCYLKGAEWNFDKYYGSSGTPSKYILSNKNLKDLATYEMVKEGSYNNKHRLCTNNQIKITKSIKGQEKDVFEELYWNHNSNTAYWDKFWKEWTKNHNNDYKNSRDGYTFTGNDWERRFFVAAYNWGSDPYTPHKINMEWWQDLRYGDDRTTGDWKPAEMVKNWSGQPYGDDRFFLNTQKQGSDWGNWLSANELDEEGEDKTLVQDRSQGGQYIDPGKPKDKEEYLSKFRKKAKEGGVYIGLECTVDEEGEIISCEFVNDIDDITEEKQFYNSLHPARQGSRYKPSNVLAIDVQKLKEKIENEMPEFNGVVYIDLEDYSWSDSHYDANADGVLLINGERLPEGGLSIITPNNVYVKGNYNLDPEGLAEKNRDPDDEEVIERVVENKDYIDEEEDLEWQPADIITTRAVYTLSEDFAKPKAMPLINDVYYQYYDEQKGYSDADIVDNKWYGTADADWMPSKWLGNNPIGSWFSHSGVPRPDKWRVGWIRNNWDGSNPYDPTPKIWRFADDTIISSRDLKTKLYSIVNGRYKNEFEYDPGREADEYQKANPVDEKHIYNIGITSAYSPDTYPVENWGSSTERVINGAFIQLPEAFQASIPAGSYKSERRYANPVRIYNYETRFGEGQDEKEQPPSSLTFGKIASWREVASF